jgi:C-terminal processing protease CtpA/Prc
MIEAGRLLMEARPLKRSVLLIAFTGEESGLLGSNYYVEHPVVPLEDTVAMINLDMIGRLSKNTISIFGTKAADEFEEMIVRLTKKSGMKLEASESALGPSDHTSFYTQKIPAMHFFTGVHTDYHQPGDDVEKIDAEGGARVTDLVVAMAREIIDADQRPTYHEVKAKARISRSGSNVAMGIMPGYADSSETPGLKIEGVLEGGPAEAAGMKDGDRIVKIGSMDVKGIYDYMGALRNNKPGDEVEVVVLRDGNKVTVKVKLASR